MNLRLEAGAVRFRISEAEFQKLRDTKKLEECVCFPGGGGGGGAFRFAIEVLEGSGNRAPSAMACPFLLFQGESLILFISTKNVDDLASLPPSKDFGIYGETQSENGALLQFALEIDLFSLGKNKTG